MRRALVLAITVACGVATGPALAQPLETDRKDDGRVVIDILVKPAPSSTDELAMERCDKEADAARVTGEILVCRDLGEASDGVYDHADFIRRYAEATPGAKAPDVDGSGLGFGLLPIIEIRGCFIPPCPPPPALIIDVEGLPEAPAGSDADRIARGLDPIDDDDELTPEEIALRNRALGIPSPRVRSAPEN